MITFHIMKFSSLSERIYPFIFILALFIPGVLEARTMHAGVPSEQLWFSKDPFFAGDTITIFTLVFNSSNYRLSGTMMLKDGTTTLDSKPFVVDAGGGSQVVTFPWLVTKGTHTFSAVITQNQLTESTKIIPDTLITATHTPKVGRFADDDKNGNGIGDSLEPPPPPAPKSSVATSSVLAVPSSNDVRKEEHALLRNLPTPIVSAAVPILGAVEDFRVSEAIKALRGLTEIEQSLNTASTTPSVGGWKLLGKGITNGEVVKSPFEHLKLFVVLILHFLTSNPYVFYLVLLFIIYKLIRFIIGLFS